MSSCKRCPFCGCDIEVKKFDYADGESAWEPDGDHDKACPLRRVLWCFFPEKSWTEERVTEAWNMRYEKSRTIVNQYGKNNTHITNLGTLNL